MNTDHLLRSLVILGFEERAIYEKIYAFFSDKITVSDFQKAHKLPDISMLDQEEFKEMVIFSFFKSDDFLYMHFTQNLDPGYRFQIHILTVYYDALLVQRAIKWWQQIHIVLPLWRNAHVESEDILLSGNKEQLWKICCKSELWCFIWLIYYLENHSKGWVPSLAIYLLQSMSKYGMVINELPCLKTFITIFKDLPKIDQWLSEHLSFDKISSFFNNYPEKKRLFIANKTGENNLLTEVLMQVPFELFFCSENTDEIINFLL